MADEASCSAILIGDAKIGFPISMIVTPPMVVESSCSLVFLLRRFAPWFGGLHGGCAWHFWSYAPLLSNITLRQRCVEVGDDRKMVSSGYAEATGLLMGLLCFFTDLGCRVPFKKDWRPDLGVDRLVFRGGNMGVATSSSGYTSLLASIHSFSFPV